MVCRPGDARGRKQQEVTEKWAVPILTELRKILAINDKIRMHKMSNFVQLHGCIPCKDFRREMVSFHSYVRQNAQGGYNNTKKLKIHLYHRVSGMKR